MADPFSAASSAIGVISLGLQIAQQLIKFCQAYQSYDEDAKRIESKAESLRRPLRALRDIIEDAQVSNPELAADLSEKALGLECMVNRLRTAVERHLPVVADGFRFPEKIRGQIKRVVYPFRRDGLKEMFEDLDGIQNSLQTTLSIHSTQKMNKLGLMQEAILEEVQQIRITLQEYPEGMPPPALLKSWCDRQCGFDENPATGMQMTTRTSTSEIAITTSSNSTSHAMTPYNPKSSNKGETTAKSFKYLSTLLRVAVTASFSLSKGAGGFSIAPSLSVQTVLDYNGSTLELQITQFFDLKKTTISEFDQTVENCIRQVQKAFSAGKSKPSDIFYLDYAPRDYNMVSYVDALVPFDIATTRDQLPGLHKLTRFLVNNGSRPNNTFSQGALRGLLRFTRFQDEEYALASYLVDHGGPCTLDNGTLNHIERYNIKYILSRYKEILIVPEVARILFQESEEELKIGLESGQIGANDKACGCSLLQLAFGWPKGVQLLLEAGASVGGGSLISFWGCPSPLREEDIGFNGFFHSTRLLLDAGCGLSIPVLQAPRSGKLLSLFASVLVKRRRKLGRLAQSCLPQEELQALGVYEDTVPDLHASRICERVAARGKTIDQSLLVRNQNASIYHNRDLIPSVMDELFNAGFKDFDSASSTNVTPLMTTYESFYSAWEGIERMVWFLSKGADISRTLPCSKAKTAHLLTVQIVGFLIAIVDIRKSDAVYFHWSSLEEKIAYSKEHLFPCPSLTDQCTCPCSPQGCTVVSVAGRQAMRWSRWSRITDKSSWLKRLISRIIDWAQSTPSAEQAVIRSLTFDALGLKHTCCIEIDGVVKASDRRDADKMVGRDPEEINEIQAENMQGMETFNQLLADFQAKFTELGLPIMEFLECYWHPHMVKHLLERDPYSEEHDRETRNIGVILQAEEEDLDRVSLLIGA